MIRTPENELNTQTHGLLTTNMLNENHNSTPLSVIPKMAAQNTSRSCEEDQVFYEQNILNSKSASLLTNFRNKSLSKSQHTCESYYELPSNISKVSLVSQATVRDTHGIYIRW